MAVEPANVPSTLRCFTMGVLRGDNDLCWVPALSSFGGVVVVSWEVIVSKTSDHLLLHLIPVETLIITLLYNLGGERPFAAYHGDFFAQGWCSVGE
jgi:hypothetical protein